MSTSTRIATELAHEIPDARVVVRDLWRNPPPHIDPAFLQATFTPEGDRTPEMRQALALSDTLIAELTASDIIVVAAGMINFSVPSGLKSWIDQVTQAGLTFQYGESGAQGLLIGKKLILVLATGGIYSEGPTAAMNHMEPALRTNLGFLGLTDVETVLIEGTAFGPEATERAMDAARSKANALAVAISA